MRSSFQRSDQTSTFLTLQSPNQRLFKQLLVIGQNVIWINRTQTDFVPIVATCVHVAQVCTWISRNTLITGDARLVRVRVIVVRRTLLWQAILRATNINRLEISASRKNWNYKNDIGLSSFVSIVIIILSNLNNSIIYVNLLIFHVKRSSLGCANYRITAIRKIGAMSETIEKYAEI